MDGNGHFAQSMEQSLPAVLKEIDSHCPAGAAVSRDFCLDQLCCPIAAVVLGVLVESEALSRVLLQRSSTIRRNNGF
jgi:hypothetical protein